jgi:hypothetical protein
VRDDLEERLAGLGRVAPEAASRVASGARRRVVDGVRAHPPARARGERSVAKAGRLGRVLRISFVVGASAVLVSAVWSATAARDAPAHAAQRPLSSFSALERQILRPNGLLGTAVLTQVGRVDALGHRFYLSHGQRGATCVVLMDAPQRLGGLRCVPRALGSARRPGEVFVRLPANATPRVGRVEIEGLVGGSVRHVRLVYADGRRRLWTPRNGVFGGAVATPIVVQLLGAQGEVLLRSAIPRSLEAG